jgi:hypothetical protein
VYILKASLKKEGGKTGAMELCLKNCKLKYRRETKSIKEKFMEVKS